MSRQDKDTEDYAKVFSGDATRSLAGQQGLLDKQAQEKRTEVASEKLTAV